MIIQYNRRSKFFIKRCFQLSRYTTTVIRKKPSYYHCLGTEPLKNFNLGQILQMTAKKYPNRESLVTYSEKSRLTFEETLDKADRLACGLLNLGLAKGDCVAIWAPNYEFWYISMFAIARAGLICVAMNPAYQLPELNYSLKKVDVKAIIAPESFRKQKHYEMLATLVPSLKSSKSGKIEGNDKNSLKHVIIYSDKKLPGAINFDELTKSSTESDIAAIEKIQSTISPDVCCNIQFSSGTTGQPKAAMLSHFNMVNNGYNVGFRQNLNIDYRRICLNNPFFHVAGAIIAITNALNHGTTLVIPDQHFNPENALEAIVEEKCDVIYALPTMFVDLVAQQRKLQLKLPPIEYGVIGGSVSTPQLIQEAKSVLGMKKIRSIYGLTEGTSTCFHSLPNEDSNYVEDFMGKVGDHMEAKVIDRDGKLVPFGEPGELCIRGYNTMLGYWGDEAKTKEVLGNDGWLKTGDQVVMYENGYGQVVGRLKEMIIRGGENLFPREIEDFLTKHPNVMEVHVVGIPDDRMGEEVGAFIRLKDPSKPLTKHGVREFCEGNIAHFKIPRYVVMVDDFPRTASGKIQKFAFLDFFGDKIKSD